MSEWKPIETAPTNEMILLYTMNRQERERRSIQLGCSTNEKSWDGLALWYTGVGSHPATHWMPLPDPPQEQP